ncbi:MAG: hypothetical protein R6T85_08870 [Egibacteraceae bacterium]
MADRDRASAYRYAWWLTGDAERAAAVVAEAADREGGAEASAEDLLRAVREAAVEAPTMRARAELALLHDTCDLPLGQAARIVGISADEAPAALAQGRLDALDEPVTVVHAERLGGLAVASPGALAHAESCPSCTQLARRLLEGRQALAALGKAVPEPPAAPGDAPRERVGDGAGDEAAAPSEAEPEAGPPPRVDTDDEAASQPAPGPEPRAEVEDNSPEATGEAAPEAAGEAAPEATGEASPEAEPDEEAGAGRAEERATRVPIRIHVEDETFTDEGADEADETDETARRRRLVAGALLAAVALAVVLAVALTAGDAGAAGLA